MNRTFQTIDCRIDYVKKSVYKLVYHAMPFMIQNFLPINREKRCNFNKHTKSLFTTFEA